MKVGDKIRIVADNSGFNREDYPFLPDDIVGEEGQPREGHITKIEEHDKTLYFLELTESFKCGIIPENVSSVLGYEPTEWYDRTDWCAFADELELIEE